MPNDLLFTLSCLTGLKVRRCIKDIDRRAVLTYACKDLCRICVTNNVLMPAYECFEMRLRFPKAYKVFYEYFYKSVVGESNWADALESKSEFGNFNTEAFTHMMLKNNYTA